MIKISMFITYVFMVFLQGQICKASEEKEFSSLASIKTTVVDKNIQGMNIDASEKSEEKSAIRKPDTFKLSQEHSKEESINGIVSVYKLKSELLQDSQDYNNNFYYCVGFNYNGESLNIALLPVLEKTFSIYNLSYVTHVKSATLEEFSKEVIERSTLIKKWEIPSNDIIKAFRRAKLDMRLLKENKISIKYHNYRVFGSSENLVYGNKSYTKCLLSFANIVPKTVEEKFLDFDENIDFDKDIASYNFNKEFSYMHSDNPTTISTGLFTSN